jgi:LysM repeat protein
LDKKSPVVPSSAVPSLALALALVVLAPIVAEAASLTPSRPGLLRQVRAANDHGFAYAYDNDDVEAMVRQGDLVRLPGNRDYEVKWTVSLPYARPEVKLFVERLAGQYRGACGQKLMVTSLVRPKNRQPANSSPLSVHPTGMALDLRVSDVHACRAWLETALLNLERRGVLEAARERRPPHYHVVVFPDPYVAYVASKTGKSVVAEYRSPAPGAPSAASTTVAAVATTPSPTAASGGGEYRVRAGDSLWTIARRFGTTTTALQRANGLTSTHLKVGQKLTLPGGSGGGTAVAAATTTTTSSSRYRVRAGDNLWSISRRFGTSVAAIQAANGLRGSALKVGQVLTIPGGGTGSGGEATAVIARYQVRRGDSLWDIAQRHGTSPRQIQQVNGLSSSRIKPGQVLTIPTAAR